MHLLDLIFPKRCVGCNKLGSYFCSKCMGKIERLKWQICPICLKPAIDGATHPKCSTRYGLDGLIIYSHYHGPIKNAIHLLKYQFVSDLAKDLIFQSLNTFQTLMPKIDYLIPVPLHRSREKQRGFNQSLLLANHLSSFLKLKVLPDVLRRIKNTKPQVDFHKSEREENIANAFLVSDASVISGKKVAIIDDVATTISTLRECAKILKKNGAEKCYGFVLAHG